MTIRVNPKIITWARTEGGYKTVEAAAAKLNKSPETLALWEASGEGMTYPELKSLAALYKRQVSVFFLRDIPKKTKIPGDRRNLRVDEAHLSPETLLAVRRTSRYLQIARDLADIDQLRAQYAWLADFKQTKRMADAAVKMRNLLGVSVNDQIKCQDSQAALKLWRDRIESQLHIYTFNFLMPAEELDGFSYIEDDLPYAITLNSRRTKNRNIFTLFHELCHILEGSSGICYISENEHTRDNPERRCDEFASELLLPKDALGTPKSYDELRQLAGKVHVSTEAYARRLYSLRLISKEVFDTFLMRIRSSPLPKPHKGEMRISPVVMSKSRRGDRFFNLVIDAHGGGRLSSSEAADILKLRPTAIDRL